jgi:HAD superfamily hydrolase (TIGR01490 family)
MRKFRESALRITAGWDQALISAIVRDTLIEVIEPIVYDEALDLIREHQAAGRRVFIISASPEEIVAPLAQYLGVDEAIASRAELDPDGRYTGNVEFWSYGPFKAEAMRDAAERHGIDLDASYAYSDSATDVPMLEAVGHPVAVNPDRELSRVAHQRDWEIRRFEHGVPLRERVSMPTPGKTLAFVAPLVIVGAGVGATLWWWRRATPSARDAVRGALGSGSPSRWAPAARAAVGARRQPPSSGVVTRASAIAERVSLRRPAASSRRMQRGRGRRG